MISTLTWLPRGVAQPRTEPAAPSTEELAALELAEQEDMEASESGQDSESGMSHPLWSARFGEGRQHQPSQASCRRTVAEQNLGKSAS